MVTSRTSADVDIYLCPLSDLPSAASHPILKSRKIARADLGTQLCGKILALLPSGKWQVSLIFDSDPAEYRTATLRIAHTTLPDEVVFDLLLDQKNMETEFEPKFFSTVLCAKLTIPVKALKPVFTILEKLSAIQERWKKPAPMSTFIRHYYDVAQVFPNVDALDLHDAHTELSQLPGRLHLSWGDPWQPQQWDSAKQDQTLVDWNNMLRDSLRMPHVTWSEVEQVLLSVSQIVRILAISERSEKGRHLWSKKK